MMLDLLGPFPLLLLLLGSWGPVLPPGAWAQPPTGVQTFILQHLRAGPVQRSTEMPPVDRLRRSCKPENTFLPDSFQNVSDTYLLPDRTCRHGQKDCHQSADPMGTSPCYPAGGTYPTCTNCAPPQSWFRIVAITTLSQATLPIFCFLYT